MRGEGWSSHETAAVAAPTGTDARAQAKLDKAVKMGLAWRCTGTASGAKPSRRRRAREA